MLQDKRNLLLFLLMRLTPCAVIGLTERIRLLEESRQSFWCKCRELGMMTLEFLCWARQTCLGLWILPSEGGSKGEYTFLCPNTRQGKIDYIQIGDVEERNEGYSQ
jgi:hypothetical protein